MYKGINIDCALAHAGTPQRQSNARVTDMQLRNEPSQAALTIVGSWSSVPNIRSQKRLVTPYPFSKSAKWCWR